MEGKNSPDNIDNINKKSSLLDAAIKALTTVDKNILYAVDSGKNIDNKTITKEVSDSYETAIASIKNSFTAWDTAIKEIDAEKNNGYNGSVINSFVDINKLTDTSGNLILDDVKKQLNKMKDDFENKVKTYVNAVANYYMVPSVNSNITTYEIEDSNKNKTVVSGTELKKFIDSVTISIPNLPDEIYNFIASISSVSTVSVQHINGGAQNDLAIWSKDEMTQVLLPTKQNGSNVYKFNMATRLILARSDIEPQLDHFPGAKEIFNNYSGAVSQKNQNISAMEYNNTIKHMIKLVRFLGDGGAYGKLFDKTYSLAEEEFYSSNGVFSAELTSNNTKFTELIGKHDDALWGSSFDMKCYQLQNALNYVIGITEDPNKTNSKNTFVSELNVTKKNKTADERSKLRMANILDLNIVPINVHAFMREVPFSNILNYSYTFDRMVHDFILPSFAKNSKLMIGYNDEPNTNREHLIKMLVYPYTNIKNEEYYGNVASVFNGVDDLRLGRPRYLSDQLWNKVLLGVTMDGQAKNKTELGPGGNMLFNATASDKYNAAISAFTSTDQKNLQYYKNGKPNTADNTVDTKSLSAIGKKRFDTKIIRNLTWLVELQRIMRVVITNHLAWIDSPVIRGIKIADPKVTEYSGDRKSVV